VTDSTALFAPKFFYFCWFVSIGLMMPFLGIYYESTGLSLPQIGILMALPGVLQLVAGPFWSLLNDALRLHRVMLPVAVAAALLPAFLISQTHDFTLLIVLVVLYALAIAPVPALSDSATLNLLGERRERYGALRAWGAVGWALSTLVSGWLVTRYGITIGFVGFVIGGLLTTVAALRLPNGVPPNVDIRAAAAGLLRDRRWGIFLLCGMLMGASSSVFHNFLPLYLVSGLGGSNEQVGFTFMLASLTELPVMALSPWLLRRWGSRRLLVAAGLFYVVRMAFSALATTPEVAIAAQVLHGPCFALLWTAGVVEARTLAPRGLETTAQSLFGTAVFGVGGSLASAFGGVISAQSGYPMVFAAGAVTALLGTLGLILGRRWLVAPTS